MRTFSQLVILSLLSWCVMTFTHELGHLLAGWSTGGTLREADLLPWHLPHSRFEPDPIPLATLWGGPILGAAIPLAVAAACSTSHTRFIASFCLLANGIYLAAAWIWPDRWLDTSRLLDAGAPPATIAIFCAATIPNGYIGLRQAWLDISRTDS